MDIILFTYLFSLLLPIFFNRKKKIDYLSIENCTSMRGIAAIGIVLHHLSERIQGDSLFRWLAVIGYILVAFFFFLSGYGLMAQYRKKKDAYLTGFLRKRVLYLIIIYLLDIALYSFFDALVGKPHTIGEIFKSIFISGIARNSWYLIVLIGVYFVFWIIFKVFKNTTDNIKIFSVFLAQLFFAVCCIVFEISPTWYYSNFGLTVGMLYCRYRSEIDKQLERRYAVSLIIIAITYCVLYSFPPLIERFGAGKYSLLIRSFCRLLSSPMSAILIVVLSYNFNPSAILWRKIGEVSFEVFLLHGLVFTFLRSDILFVQSDALWTVLTVVISIICAFPAHWLNKRIALLCRR